jgi:hypothetical protein
MVILTQDLHGLGNCLLQTSHFLVNAADTGYELAIPAFERYAPYFEATAGRRSFRFGPQLVHLDPPQPMTATLFRMLQWRGVPNVLLRLPWLVRPLGYRLVADLPVGDVDLNSPEFQALAHDASCPLLVHGWQYRDKPGFARHADRLRQFFRPVAAHREAIAQVLTANRAHADVLVGVHIRRGDYAGWYGGAYLYSHTTYARVMHDVEALFPAGTRVRFLLFSNEPIPDEAFAAFDTGRATNHELEDMYTLAGCDYIVGPLSTYSMWASFYGRVPLCHLHRPDQLVTSLEEFVVFQDQEAIRWESEMAPSV